MLDDPHFVVLSRDCESIECPVYRDGELIGALWKSTEAKSDLRCRLTRTQRRPIMPTRQARSIARIKAARVVAGLCRERGQPSDGRYRCAECRKVRAEEARERRKNTTIDRLGAGP